MARVERAAAASAALAWCILMPRAEAQESCSARIARSSVVPCALGASVAVRAELQGVEVVEGRKKSVQPWFPSNPELSLSGAKRRSPTQGEAVNWYSSLSQELEVAGQRRARLRAVGQEREAQEQTVATAERDVAARAWDAYFQVLAARDLMLLARRLEQTFQRALVASQAAAASGLVAGIDADLEEVTFLRLVQARIAATRRHATATAYLATLLGLDPSKAQPDVEGELVPLANVQASRPGLAENAVSVRPELRAKDATQASYSQWADAYRRSRVLNPKIQVYAQRDGFQERVIGAGLSLPIPLPSNVGRMYAGEIAQSEALSRRTALEREGVRRAVLLEVVAAQQAFQAAQEERALFTDERAARAEQSLNGIADQLAAGQIAISDVVLAQQALIDVLRANVEAKLALCLSSVELARAAGLPLEGAGL